MKIAILTSGILPVPAVQGGAVEILVDHLLEYNDKHQLHDITVFSVCHPDVKNHPALLSVANHYHYIDTRSLLSKVRKGIHGIIHRHSYYHNSIDYFFKQALRTIRRQDFDAILIENRPGYALGLQGNTKARLIYHLHNDFLNSTTPYGKEIYQSASMILTVSDFIRERVQTCDPKDSKTVSVHNGIDLTLFSEAIPLSHESLGYEQDDFILAFSGRLTPEKGILELIMAMRMLKAYPKIKLLVLGSSFFGNADKDNAFIHELKSCAAELERRIKFTGYVKHELMPGYLQLADVAVIPSTWDDPFPTTVLEAMAAGLPIITTNRGGIPEMVTKDNAIVIPYPGDLTGNLAKAILALYYDKERREYMGSVSRVLSKKYAKEICAKNFFDALASVKDQ